MTSEIAPLFFAFIGECLYVNDARSTFRITRESTEISQDEFPRTDCLRFVVPRLPVELLERGFIDCLSGLSDAAPRLPWCRGITLVSASEAACCAARVTHGPAIVVIAGWSRTPVLPVCDLKEVNGGEILQQLGRMRVKLIYKELRKVVKKICDTKKWTGVTVVLVGGGASVLDPFLKIAGV